MKTPREALGKVGFVGAGGGFRGACISGFLEPLIRAGVPVDYLGAVSVSALVLAKVSEARNQNELLEQIGKINSIWERIEEGGPRTVFNFSYGSVWRGVHRSEFLDHKPLFRLVSEFDPERSIASPIRFDVFVYDSDTMEHKTFSNRDPLFAQKPDLLRSVVVASASLRPIFPPLTIGDRRYHDGGFINLEGALSFGCDTIFVLFPYPARYQRPKPPETVFEKTFPILEEFSAIIAAALRERDYSEMHLREEALRLGADYNLLLSSYEKLLRENEEFKRKVEGSGGDRGRWFNRIIRAFSSAEVSAAGRKPQFARVRCPRIIEFHGEPSITLTVKKFEKGDLTAIREKAKIASETWIQNELSQLLR